MTTFTFTMNRNRALALADAPELGAANLGHRVATYLGSDDAIESVELADVDAAVAALSLYSRWGDLLTAAEYSAIARMDPDLRQQAIVRIRSAA